MQPPAISLNYSVKNIRKDVRQIILYEKSQFNTLSVGLAHPNYDQVNYQLITIEYCITPFHSDALYNMVLPLLHILHLLV